MIAENIKHLKERIDIKCAEIKRNPQEIRLIAVSKFFGIDAINEANTMGITDFGENKAQELRDKYEILVKRLPGISSELCREIKLNMPLKPHHLFTQLIH